MAEEHSASMDAAKKKLAEEKKISNRSREEFVERTKGKPTPTQEENDLHALGVDFREHEADGSAPDPNVKHAEANKPVGEAVGSAPDPNVKHVEADKPAAGYQTRHTQAAPAPVRAPVHPNQAS